MTVKKVIEVIPYDANWPNIFEDEAASIRKVLGDNFLAIHHIGSTAVPKLIAKPIIDIIAVAKDGEASIAPLEQEGFTYKGELNIPFKFVFIKRGKNQINLHVFEKNHPEIELNILFRNHLRSNPESMLRYASIKEMLLTHESSFEKQEGKLFSGYNLGKDEFIRSILIQEGYAGHRFLKVTHHKEWESYHRIKKERIFDPINVVYNPNHPAINSKEHVHFILCQGTNIVTIAHIEFLNKEEAALRALATDAKYQLQGYGKEMMKLLEKWLKSKKIKFLKMHAGISAEALYRKLGYNACDFDDPCICERYVNLGKAL